MEKITAGAELDLTQEIVKSEIQAPAVVFTTWNAAPGQSIGIYGGYFGSLNARNKTRAACLRF